MTVKYTAEEIDAILMEFSGLDSNEYKVNSHWSIYPNSHELSTIEFEVVLLSEDDE